MHFEILNDPRTVYFNETMDCYNFQNKVNFTTHEAGHSLDIFMSRDDDGLISSVRQGYFISDHCLIITK